MPKSLDRGLLLEIIQAVKSDKKIHVWPDHIVAQAGRVSEASGILLNSSFVVKYNVLPNSKDKAFLNNRMRTQAINVIAAALRFLENFSHENININHEAAELPGELLS